MKSPLLPMTALLLAPGIALAAAVPYNYVDVRYMDADNSLNGVGAEASGLIADQVFVRGGLSLLSGRGVDLNHLRAEIGYLLPVDPRFDLIGSIGGVYADVDGPGSYSDSDFGLTLGGGIRARFTPQVEASLLATHDRVFSGSNTFLTLGGLYHFNPQWAAGVSYVFDDNDALTLGVRFHY